MLPQWLEPRKLAQQEAVLEGVIGPEQLPRLAAAVEALGPVVATLQFANNDNGLPAVTGRLQMRVGLLCQRCLLPLEREIAATLHAVIVTDEKDAQQLPPAADPWVVPQAMADIYPLVEDELLLALPMAPTHGFDSCARQLDQASSGEDPPSRPSPFAALGQLKGTVSKRPS